MPTLRRASPLAVLALASVGCIAFVSSPESGDRCTFRGEATACGRCLRESCQDAINHACGESTTIATMEECAEASTDACARITPGPVASCLTEKCSSVCYAKTGTSVTSCEDSFLSPGLACDCVAGGATNDVKCTSAGNPRGLCCAADGWPGPALGCACKTFSCVPSGGGSGCVCNLSGDLEGTESETCTAAKDQHCCAAEDHCQCLRPGCSGGEREVAACTRGVVGCPKGTHAVESCSIRR